MACVSEQHHSHGAFLFLTRLEYLAPFPFLALAILQSVLFADPDSCRLCMASHRFSPLKTWAVFSERNCSVWVIHLCEYFLQLADVSVHFMDSLLIFACSL